MKENEDEKERMDWSGRVGAAHDAGRRDRDSGLLAQQPDTDARTLAHCPRKAIAVGPAFDSCARDGDGFCWRCDGFGLPVVVSDAIPDGHALFVGNSYVYAVDLAKPDSFVALRLDADGTFHTIPDRDEGGGES